MPQRIKPKHVTYIEGKDGNMRLQIDHQIDLNLTINLDSAGGIKVNVSGKYTEEKDEDVQNEDKVDWAIPDFSSDTLFDFGKDIEQE